MSPISNQQAERQISKTAKQCIAILIVLLLGSLGFAAVSVLEKQKLQKTKFQLEGQLKDSQDRESKKIVEINDLKTQVEKINQDKLSLQGELSKTQKELSEMTTQLETTKKDKNDWQIKLDTIKTERDDLFKKQEELKTQIADLEKKAESYKTQGTEQNLTSEMTPELAAALQGQEGSESDWVGLVKAKAALDVKLNRLQEELSNRSSEILTLKQQNEDLQMKFDSMTHDKEQIATDIEDKTQVADNLANELARAKNDKKFVGDRVEKLNAENKQLRAKLKELAASKKSLENAMVQLNQDKNKIAKKLDETEGVVQKKIDEIWNVKEDLNNAFEQNKAVVPEAASKKSPTASKSSQMELKPIVINSSSEKPALATEAPQPSKNSQAPGFNGRIVSINEDNHFVVLNIGEDAGLRLGQLLNVYRDSQYIGQVEVIQLRKNIAAADFKSQWTKIQVGDQVK